MALPRGDEYSQAVQNPKIAFADSDLRNCTVEVNQLGLPKPYSGGFTTTYRLYGNNSQDWAVRCFTREVSELERRYQAIGRFITQNANSLQDLFVYATYLQRGIRVGSNWYPVIKMQWIDGIPLNSFVRNNLTAPKVFAGMWDQFANLVARLEMLGVAHGDLQHGNIIVKNGRLYLIDYDGMYLPELSDLLANEVGHINYQHPQREASDYSPAIDRFSSIVIYLGLKALALKPDLWHKYDNNENILFTRRDFTDPERSALLHDLVSLPQLASQIQLFKDICYSAFDQVPTLQQFISGKLSHAHFQQPKKIVSQTLSQYPILDASSKDSLIQHAGLRVEVVGRVESYHRGLDKCEKPYLFLNFGMYPYHTLTLVFWSDLLSKLGLKNVDTLLERFMNKWVSVTGIISIYVDRHDKERPQIAIEDLSQIQRLKDEAEALERLTGAEVVGETDITTQADITTLEEDEDIADQAKPAPEPLSLQPWSPQEPLITKSDVETLEKLFSDEQKPPSGLSAQPSQNPFPEDVVLQSAIPQFPQQPLTKSDVETLEKIFGNGQKSYSSSTTQVSGSTCDNQNRSDKSHLRPSTRIKSDIVNVILWILFFMMIGSWILFFLLFFVPR